MKLNNIKGEKETVHGLDKLASFSHDLSIYEDCDIIPESNSKIGWNYESPNGIKFGEDESETLMAKEFFFYIDEIEVY